MLCRRRLNVLGMLALAGIGTARAEEHEPAAKARPAYLALGEFTINLPTRNDQLSYAVISITIEAVPAAAQELRGVEPRLKEAVMRRLMAMADRGVLQPNHTDLAAVKEALLSSLLELQPNSIKDVLIVRLLYG